MTTPNKRLAVLIIASALLLLVPLCAMRFTDEVNWTALDFIVAGALLLGASLICELVMRKVKTVKYRIAICTAVLLAVLVVWIELAVGIFNSPFGGS